MAVVGTRGVELALPLLEAEGERRECGVRVGRWGEGASPLRHPVEDLQHARPGGAVPSQQGLCVRGGQVGARVWTWVGAFSEQVLDADFSIGEFAELGELVVREARGARTRGARGLGALGGRLRSR